ncbi:putative leader peptide [Streptomyces sp. M2CJ-2]|uniref:putative leader peptide n=1 Tax=Streptomyces sp. M2CJ-2 TaxID=2803948 RepID=UPI0034D77272
MSRPDRRTTAPPCETGQEIPRPKPAQMIYAPGMVMLVSRRHVDLVRVASAICRFCV